jgi:hypothetical protein
MDCPETDRLVDLYFGEAVDPDVEEHVLGCPSCQEELRFQFLVSAAWESREEVPEGLVERALARIPAAGTERRGASPWPVMAAALLGVLTVLGGLGLTGTLGVAGPLVPLVLSATVGVAAAVFQLRDGRAERMDAVTREVGRT